MRKILETIKIYLKAIKFILLVNYHCIMDYYYLHRAYIGEKKMMGCYNSRLWKLKMRLLTKLGLV